MAFDDNNLKIEWYYNFVRSNQPSNSRRSGIYIYNKQSLALKILDVKYLQEFLVFKVLIANRNFISLY